MAIYHFDLKIISRVTTATTITAKAAYRAGEKLYDPTVDQTFDYSRRRNVYGSEILLPEGAPSWAGDRTQLWVAVERKEDTSTQKKTAQLAREIILALPKELTDEQRLSVTRDYVQSQFVNRGMVADVAFHDFDLHNPHAHVLLTMRDLKEDGFGNKNRSWNNQKLCGQWRERWAQQLNVALERAGHDARVDHRSLEAQGIDREPQVHLGPQVIEMERKGIRTDVGDTYRAILTENQRRLIEQSQLVSAATTTTHVMHGTFTEESQPQAKPSSMVQLFDQRSLIEQLLYWQQALTESEQDHSKPFDRDKARSWGLEEFTIETLATCRGHQAIAERERRIDAAHHYDEKGEPNSGRKIYLTALKHRLITKGRSAYRYADRWLAERLVRRGYTRWQTRGLIARYSPELMEEEPGRRLSFIRRTVERVYRRREHDTQQQEHRKATRKDKSEPDVKPPTRSPSVNKPSQPQLLSDAKPYGKFSAFEVRHEMRRGYQSRYQPFYDPANENLVLDNPNHGEFPVVDLDADLVAAIKQAARLSRNAPQRLKLAHRMRADTEAEHSDFWEGRGGYFGTAKREYAKELSRMAEAKGDDAVLTPESDQKLVAKLRVAGFGWAAINKAVIEHSPVAASLPSTQHQSKYLELLVKPTLQAPAVRRAKEAKRREMQAKGMPEEYRLDRMGLATEVSQSPQQYRRRGRGRSQ